MNWNWINERLATGGGIQTKADANALIAAGVTCVVDCREEEDFPIQYDTRIIYFHNGVPDDGQHGPAKEKWLQASLWQIVRWLFPTTAYPETIALKAKVYAHCSAGHNRGPSTVYMALRAMGMSPFEAKVLIYAAHPLAIGGIAYAEDADNVMKSLS